MESARSKKQGVRRLGFPRMFPFALLSHVIEQPVSGNRASHQAKHWREIKMTIFGTLKKVRARGQLA